MITKRQAEILRIMRDDGEELVYEKGEGWVGTEKIAPRTLFAFLRLLAISHDSTSRLPGLGLEIYHINSTGKDLLEKFESQKGKA